MRFKHRKTILVIILAGIILSNFAFIQVDSAYATDGGGGWAAAAAGWAHFAKYVLKEFVLDLAARLVARLQLNRALNGIANQVIRAGRTGRTPAFIQNWRNFITNAEYRGEDVFRSMLANTQNCPQFRRQLLGTFGVRNSSPLVQNTRVGSMDPYTLRARCTLPRGFNINNYDRDFTGNGGWDALTRLAEPQNTFFGSLLMAMGEVDSQRRLESRADLYEGGSGGGFTGIRKSKRTGNSCDTPPTSTGRCVTIRGDDGIVVERVCSNIGGICAVDADCTKAIPSEARCTFLGDVTTPSEFLGQAGAEFIDSNLKWLTTSDEVSEIVADFVQTMISKLADWTANAIAPSNVTDPNKSRYDACIVSCNNFASGQQYGLCIDRCARNAGVDLPPNYDTFQGDPTPPVGGGVCADPLGSPARYSNVLQNAINAVNAANPGGIADQLNTFDNSVTYIQLLITEIRNQGFQASQVLNGNDVPHPEEYVAIWQTGDTLADRFEAVNHAGDGDMTLRNAAQSTEFSGQVSIASCVTGGGTGGSCNNNGVCDAGEDAASCSADCGSTNPPAPTPTITECNDGADNDTDGRTDFDGAGTGIPDPDCGGDPLGASEGIPLP